MRGGILLNNRQSTFAVVSLHSLPDELSSMHWHSSSPSRVNKINVDLLKMMMKDALQITEKKRWHEAGVKLFFFAWWPSSFLIQQISGSHWDSMKLNENYAKMMLISGISNFSIGQINSPFLIWVQLVTHLREQGDKSLNPYGRWVERAFHMLFACSLRKNNKK